MRGSLRDKLARDEVCLGLSLRQARTADTARILADCGFDWMFLDLEHGPLSFDVIVQLALAGLEAGVSPLVRTAGHDPVSIGRALSNGALGIIAPHVDTPAQAAEIARQCRFAPLGARSVPGAFPQLGYAPRSFREAAEILNRETLVVVMIESPEAVANVEAIAAVDGVDALFVGTSDLTFGLGVPAQYDHPSMRTAMGAVTAAARRHGKIAGLGGIADARLIREHVQAGMRLILAGNDLAVLADGLRRRTAALRGTPAPRPSSPAGCCGP